MALKMEWMVLSSFMAICKKTPGKLHFLYIFYLPLQKESTKSHNKEKDTRMSEGGRYYCQLVTWSYVGRQTGDALVN